MYNLAVNLYIVAMYLGIYLGSNFDKINNNTSR